jgi:rfaE bifunctional protein kinase chain/domain/rfaE bifunctional protein nucleotidyltransferase chain/domain
LEKKKKSKFYELSDLVLQLNPHRSLNNIIIQCHGVFDLIHPGHISHLEEAKKLGDILVVTITPDKYVNKGPGRPIYSELQRADMLQALEVVDFVALTDSPTAKDSILTIKPNYYVKGPDYTNMTHDISGNIMTEEEAVCSIGGKIHFTKSPAMSSSRIINQNLSNLSFETSKWLSEFRLKYEESEILSWIMKVSSLNILVIGEAIIDEYVYCEALGKSSKDPVLAFREIQLERQIGGSLAIANHCAGLGAKVYSLCRIGNNRKDKELILNNLNPDINAVILESLHEPTITKRRYIDDLTESRVFETYLMDESLSTSTEEHNYILQLQKMLPQVDLVLIADYGHGLITEKVIEQLVKSEVPLAVNTQANAGNRGFNTISKYPRVDYVSLNGSEMGLELKRKHGSMDELVQRLRNQTGAKRVVITEGARGLLICGNNDIVEHVPAFAQIVKDRVGAGDALFATTSLLSILDTPKDVTGFFGNLAGAAVISELGNRKVITFRDLCRHASALLK